MDTDLVDRRRQRRLIGKLEGRLVSMFPRLARSIPRCDDDGWLRARANATTNASILPFLLSPVVLSGRPAVGMKLEAQRVGAAGRWKEE